MTAYPISSPQALLNFLSGVFDPKVKRMIDAATIDSLLVCTRQFMTKKELPIYIAYQMLHLYLYANLRQIGLEICEYCCEVIGASDTKNNHEYFLTVLSILREPTPDQAATLKALYHIKSMTYHDIAYPGEDELRRILGSLRLPDIREALDLGCGSGRVGQILRASGYAGGLTGIDISPSMLTLARDSQAYTELVAGEILTSLGAYEKRFDLATMIWVAAHCSRQELFDILAVVATALRAGGVFIFDINADLEVDERNNAVGTTSHAASQIVTAARTNGFFPRYQSRQGRVFFRCTKAS